MALLRALPEEYNSLRATLFIQGNLNLQTVETAFLAEDNQRQHAARDNVTALRTFTTRKPSHRHQHSSASQPETAPPSTSSSAFKQNKSNITCYFCKNVGHTERECKIKKAAQKTYLQHRSAKANVASESTPETDADSNDEFAGSASTFPIPSNARSNLNADTGATRSMMSNEKFFSTLRPLVRTIRLANGAQIQSKGEGDIVFQPWVDGEFTSNLITFPNVLFAPDLQSNLLSVLSLVQRNNYEVRINKDRMEFYCGGKLHMTARIDNNCVAYLDGRIIPAETANAVSTLPLNRELWHRRLAHVNFNTLDNLIRHDLLHDLQLDSNAKPDAICTPCISGKQTRAVHTMPSTRSDVLLHRVSTDLHGPIHTEALPSRARYWMPFVDEASGYVVLTLLRSKDGAFEAFQKYKAMAENQTACRIKHLRDDKGGEFISEKFQKFCDAAGIVREHTIRATPEQNGRVERVNRWIAEGATAKLVEANLPPSFWGLAALACVHEMNRARIHEGKTPYEHWHGEKPSVKRMRVFGCAAYVHVQKDQRRALEPHTTKCVFVGYPSDRSGWMFWNPLSRKLVYSDSAIFDERAFPGTKQPKEARMELLPEIQLELPTKDIDIPAPREQAEPPDQPDNIELENNPAADDEPAVIVGGQPVHHPAPLQNVPANPPTQRQRPRVGARELRGLLDATNFEKRPQNILGARATNLRSAQPRQQVQDDSDEDSVTSDGNDDSDEYAHEVAITPTPEPPVSRQRWKIPRSKPPSDPLRPDFIQIPIVDGIECALNTSTAIEPKTLAEALRRPDGDKYLDSAIAEIKAHLENGTWELARLPRGKRAIGSRWVFKIKRKADGSIDKYKGRIVAKGYAQREGVDYTETFAPTARFGALRTVIALAAMEDWELESVDISTAFLNGDIDAEVYMLKPEGVEFPGFEGSEWVLRLLKGLYGIKQGPRIWSQKLHAALASIGFQRLESDHSVFIYERDGVKMVVPVHVDDLVLASSSKSAIAKVKDDLRARFKIHEQGPTSFLLGVKLERDRKNRMILLSQPAYIDSILQTYRMQDCNTVKTPMSEKARLSSTMSPVSVDEKEDMKNVPYREALGKLLYLSIATRPDISYAVGVLCRFSENPGRQHWSALKRVIRYLKGTQNLKLTYTPARATNEPFVTFSDADLGGNVDNSRSTAGFAISVGGGAVLWSSRLQRHTSLSSTESEYTTASATGCEIIWMREFLDEIGYDISLPSTLFVDNNSAILVAKNPEHQSTMKHVNRSYHWIREKVADKEIKVEHIPGADNPADIFTKPLGRVKFTRFREMLGLMS
jgi:Reverse transcriptase (RNA-dependent DNA polymerase)/GAG-pre-integrase domain